MNSISALSSSVEQLDLTYKGYSYAQKQQPFKALIQSLEQTRSPQLENVCREYVRRYPFNTTIWNSLAQQIKVSHSAQESENIYREGVAQNSRSLELWQYFFSAIKSDTPEEPKLKMLHEEAASKVGFDFSSSALWDELIRLSSNNSYNKIETFNLYRRVLTIPIKNLDNFRDKFNAFFSTLTPEQVLLAYQQTFGTMPDQELSQEGMSHQIKLAMNAAADKSKTLLTEVASFEIKLSKTEFDGQSTVNDVDIWNQYISFARQRFTAEHIIFLYEKALIANCDKSSLWEDYFSYLDSQQKNTEALEVARKLNLFFKSLQDTDLLLLLAELEELNGNSAQARELYQSIEGELSVKSCTRWSQFEDRVGSGLSSEVFEKMISNPSGMKPETYAWAINRLAKSLLNNSNSTKQSALSRYLSLFETGPISKVGYSQLLCFFSDNFVNEPDFINSLAEIYSSTLQTVKKATPGDQKDYVTLSLSHLRTVAPTLAELRKIESRIRGVENGQSGDSEGLNAKRSLSKLLGEEGLREAGQEPSKQLKVV